MIVSERGVGPRSMISGSFAAKWRMAAGTNDFDNFAEWRDFAAAPGGEDASISRYLNPTEAVQQGASIQSLYLDAVRLFQPLLSTLDGSDAMPELDPIPWTSSEGRILWPEWDQAKRGDGYAGSSRAWFDGPRGASDYRTTGHTCSATRSVHTWQCTVRLPAPFRNWRGTPI